MGVTLIFRSVLDLIFNSISIMDIDREIDFIAKYYKEGLFNADKALRQLKPKIRKAWSWPRIAAVSSVIIVLGATAALLIRNSYYSKPTVEIENPSSTNAPLESVSKVIDFDDAPLPVVIDRINSVYDVEVINIPADADEYRLSLHYEGNVLDLLEAINEILGTDLEIEK